MRDKVRIGIIGTGQIAKQHLLNYSKIPEAEVVAVCDIREDEMQRVAQQYQVAGTYTDYRELLKREDIDCVDVCLHNYLHAPVSIAAFEAGKHVYCEKPMSWTYGESKAMIEAAQRAGKMLHIQLASIYTKETRAARRLLDEGHLGKVYYVKCFTHRRRNRPFVDGYGTKEFVNSKTSGGGTLLDMAIYSLGRMMYLLDAPKIVAASGVHYQETGMYDARREISGYDVEEMGIGLVRLENGMTLFLESTWAAHSAEPEGDQIMGAKGGMRLEPFTYFTTLSDMEMDGSFDLDTADWRWHQVDPQLEGYDSSQKHWIWAQLGRVPLLDTARYALRSSQLTEGIYLSAQLGREVTAAEIEAAPERVTRE